jgi:serine protease Do
VRGRGKRIGALSIALAIGVGAMGGACQKFMPGGDRDREAGLPPGAILVPTAPPPPMPQPEPLPSPSPAGASDNRTPLIPLSFAALAKAVDAGVVTIISRIEEVRPGGRRRIVGEGLGTGFVYDRSGLVLTNNHVVEDASEISVKLAEGRELAAKIVGRDKPADVAVVRVDDKSLTPLPLGDSDGIEVGDWVVAIGNPFGLSHTVSAGILSAKGRTHDDVKGLDPAGYFNFLQTDAAINQGNSGGPLLSLKGEVVGINSAIRANANNIGFAIPINMVKELLPILLREGKVTRSALGIIVDPVNETEATRLHRPDRRGAWIKMVVPGGGADRAGLTADDLILAFDGKGVQDPNQLRWWASLAGVGKTVPVRVQRAEKIFDVRVTLGPLLAAQDDDDAPRMPFMHP